MSPARSIEVKVGLLILSAIVLLVAFILVMGGLSFQPTYELKIGFDNPGGLQSGAPVKIAGVKVGKVKQIDFRATNRAEKKGERGSLVSVNIGVEKRYQSSIHEDATFYITTQGVLGEQFLAIDPGSADQPVLKDNAHIRGLDPPRLDRLIAESYDLLHTTVRAIRQHRPQLKLIVDGLGKTLKGTGDFMERHAGNLDKVAENVTKMSDDGAQAVETARKKYVENPAIDRIIAQIDRTTASTARDLPPMLTQSKSLLASASKLTGALSSDKQLARIDSMMADLATTTKLAKAATTDAQHIAAHIRRGRGSMGALVMDEQLFDDLQELARDLKHNPWKFFWRE